MYTTYTTMYRRYHFLRLNLCIIFLTNEHYTFTNATEISRVTFEKYMGQSIQERAK